MINTVRLGSELGGWTVDVDSIPDGSTIIDAGIGFDISFPQELCRIRPNLQVVMVDPVDASMQFAASWSHPHAFINKAISTRTGKAPLYNLLQHSCSLNSKNRNVERRSFTMVDTVSLRDLVETYNPSFMKLDLEGAEFDCYRQAFGVLQVAIEFHHRNIRGMRDDKWTRRAVRDFHMAGYIVIHTSPYDQITFLKVR